jgi:glycogen synthase
MKKKVIIIGSGPGGLASAMILSNRGFDVVVYERKGVVGGRTSPIEANGFTFRNYDLQEFLLALTRVLETFKHKKAWRTLVCRGMKSSFSWELPAKKYVELYYYAKKYQNDKQA